MERLFCFWVPETRERRRYRGVHGVFSLVWWVFVCVFRMTPLWLSLSLSHLGFIIGNQHSGRQRRQAVFFHSGLMPLLSHEQAHDFIFVLAAAATSQPAAAAAAFPLDRNHTPTIASPVLSQSVIFDTTVLFPASPSLSLWIFRYFLDPRRGRRRHQPPTNTRGNPGGGTGMGWDIGPFISNVFVSIPGLFLSF